ncbi:hypothetical protein MMC30_001993 [Trapelia coarctata]|nr:hypothetical protein [Trapelia coarctata]
MSKDQGAFVYPPINASLSFNYLDTVNVTWNTYVKYTSNVSLQLWIAEGDKKQFVTVYQTNVSADGSASVPLNWTNFSTAGHFQISFADNGTGYGSNSFKISYNPSQRPTTWNMPSQTQPIFTTTSAAGSAPSAAPSGPSTAEPSALHMADLSSGSATNRPSTGAIVGIVIACLFFLAVVVLVIWVIRRSQQRQPSRNHSSSTTNSTSTSERSRRRKLDPEKRDMVHELWAGEVATELEAEGIGNYDRRNAFVERSRFSF